MVATIGKTRDAKRGNQVGLGQALFNELGLKEGDAVRVTQGVGWLIQQQHIWIREQGLS